MWTTPGFAEYAALTVWHVGAAIFVAFCVGLAVCLATYFMPVLELAVYARLAPFLNSFPGVGWAYLGLIWFGINSKAVILSSALAMTPLAIINLGAGLRALDQEIIEMSKSMTRLRRRWIGRIILPLLFPYMFATVRLCFGVAWQIVLVVELLSGAKGLAAIVSLARQRYWTDMIFAVVALVLLIVFLIDRGLFAYLHKKIGRAYGN
ncbi:ABC transporter permease [Rhizobium sp. LEGMi135b]